MKETFRRYSLPFFLFILLIGLTISACKPTDGNEDNLDKFPREEVLTFWADEIIIPAFDTYVLDLQNLNIRIDNFVANPTESSLSELRIFWFIAYRAWQQVSMFDIGVAEEIGLRNYTNIYPANVEEIEENISAGNVNLNLPSNFDAQGFPALDYLLFGLSTSDDQTVLILSQDDYSDYLKQLGQRLFDLSSEVQSDWTANYRSDFIANSGSSGTASVDKLVNDFLFYFERFFRAGKIGIPAGVFSGNLMPASVEAPFSGIYTRDLYFEAYIATRNFFEGKSYDGLSTGPSLSSYLVERQDQNNLSDINADILFLWDQIREKNSELDKNFKEYLETDNVNLLAVYDDIQAMVILLKVDMMQALNIQVDYVDADGD